MVLWKLKVGEYFSIRNEQERHQWS